MGSMGLILDGRVYGFPKTGGMSRGTSSEFIGVRFAAEAKRTWRQRRHLRRRNKNSGGKIELPLQAEALPLVTVRPPVWWFIAPGGDWISSIASLRTLDIRAKAL
jgi:hypothetical protein